MAKIFKKADTLGRHDMFIFIMGNAWVFNSYNLSGEKQFLASYYVSLSNNIKKHSLFAHSFIKIFHKHFLLKRFGMRRWIFTCPIFSSSLFHIGT